MKIVKRLLIVIIALVVVLQFVRPPRNTTEVDPAADINAKFNVPQDIRDMLRTSCYDCHSNSTRYPWYANVQPIGWWLNSHIQEARRELNFSEFSSYRVRRQFIKLQQIGEQVGEEEMPLPSYLILHTDARLGKEQRDKIVAWANSLRETMKGMYPPDSLERKGR